MHLSKNFALVSAFALSACVSSHDPVEDLDLLERLEISESCGGDQTCEFSEFLTKVMNKNAGNKLGDTAILRGAQNDGHRVTVQLDVSEEFRNEPTTKGRTIEQEMTHVVGKEICSDSAGRSFLQSGGEIVVETYLLSGKRFSRSIIDRCG